MSVSVLGPNARRVKVAVTPNTTLQEVLTKSCQDLSLDPEQFDLLHQTKVLDLSLTIRFANLSNNAQLELKKLTVPRVQSNVSIAVQSESGQRTTGLFMPDTSLYQVIAETSGFPAVKKGQQVVCLFTRREIFGEENLRSTTLKSLGLNSGSAVLRTLVRDEVVLGGQAFVEDLRLKKDAGKGKAAEKVVSDVKQNVSKSLKSLKKMVSNAFESIEKSTDLSNPKKKSQTTDSGGQRLGSSYDQPSSSASESSQAAAPTPPAPPSACSSSSSDAKQPQPSPPEAVTNGKINFIGERDALIFSQSDIPKMHSKTDADDSFFEITKEDVMIMYQDLKDQVRQIDNRPLETSRLRELRKTEKAKKYEKAVLRICFPNDGLVIQANFTPTECISHVAQFIRPFLIDQSMDFYLFTTPPKVVLKSDETLHTLKLVPAANIHFGYNSQSKVLKADLNDQVTPFDAIIQATSQLRAQIARSACLVEREAVNPSIQDTREEERKPQAYESAPSSEYIPKVQTSTDKVPKWFKKGK